MRNFTKDGLRGNFELAGIMKELFDGMMKSEISPFLKVHGYTLHCLEKIRVDNL
jgi:hypothetical protein